MKVNRKEKCKTLKVIFKKSYHGEINYSLLSLLVLSRNVLDTLTVIWSLKAKDINIYFEVENLNSFRAEKEIDITFNGILTQKESRNLSENA